MLIFFLNKTNRSFSVVLPVLFLCCDMRETNALIPIMQELQTNEVDFQVIAMELPLPN
jgi:hypothetical protein